MDQREGRTIVRSMLAVVLRPHKASETASSSAQQLQHSRHPVFAGGSGAGPALDRPQSTVLLVRIGIYLDLRNPPPWRRPWPDLYARGLELAERTERLGGDSIWLTEHHFFEDGYLAQPMTFAAAIAARTSRVRIGTAVLLAPLRPAVQIAEDAAVVDLVSNGRLDLGLGAGYRPPEFVAFGADLQTRFRATEARAVEIRRLLDGGELVPGTVQRPLPLWIGYGSAAGARRVGRLGEGLLIIERNLLAPYVEGLTAGGHDPSTARMAGLVNTVLVDDPDEAWPRIKPHFEYQWNSYRRYSVEGTGKPEPRWLDGDRLRGSHVGPAAQFHLLTVDDAVGLVQEAVEGLPVTDAFFWASIAGMPDDLVDRHLELLLTELRPRLAERAGRAAGATRG